MFATRLWTGTWSWGDSTWADPNNTVDANRESFKSSVSHGVNVFDTAEIYGRGESERRLGQFIREARESKETEVFVATKFIPLPWTLFRSSFHSALDGSLQRLGIPAIDLYQIHSPNICFRTVEVWAEELAIAYNAGKIKAIGVSNYNSEQVRRTEKVLAAKGLHLSSNQIEYSLLHRFPEVSGLIATCKELNVEILAYSPLASGRLTGKYTRENPPQGSRRFGVADWDQVDAVIAQLKQLGAKYSKTPSQVALNWCIAKGTIPLSGSKNGKQAEENAGALGWLLNAEEVAELDKVSFVGKTDFWQGSST